MHMLVGADFRGTTYRARALQDLGRKRTATGRVGPKDHALELKRFKILCTKEGVDPSGLTAADRYGRMIALKFSSSSRAHTFERDFKTIDFGGKYSHFWAEAAKNTKGVRLQVLAYVIGDPSRKDGATKTGLSSLDNE